MNHRAQLQQYGLYLIAARLLYVITSYSIHYTKLYDGYVINVDIDLSADEFDSNGVNYYFCTNGGGMPELDYYAYTDGNTDTPIIYEPDYDYGRITSYNVCYTKLLRRF